MQEVQNETDAVLHRRTKGGRNLTYVLKVVQPPARARACGSGDKASTDRRPVDPPPVVRLQILCGDVDITASYESSFMLFASLEHARPYARGTLAATNHFAVLKGLAVAGAAYLAKPISAAYFIFPDLSVQHEGYYRLKFHLFESAQPDDWDLGHERQMYQDGFEDAPPPDDQLAMRCMTYVYSRPFTVYSAKKFPGLAQSTELSRIIADQGCRVRIRRDIRQRRSEPKHAKKEDGHAPLRAETQTSVDSIQPTLEQWNRPPAPDARRPSADSQISQKYTPTQQPSYSQGSLRSPSIAGSSNRYQSIGPCNSSGIPPPPLVAEPDDMYASSLPPMRPTVTPLHAQAQSLAPPKPWASQPSPRSPTQSFPSCALPPIESLLNPQSPRPPGGLYPTTPLAQKRGHSTSREERTAAFKDGARPQLTPISRANPYSYSVPPLTAGGTKAPLVGVNQIIEADDDEEDDDTHSVDSLLEFTNSYRRADGTKHNISTAKHSYEQ